MSEWFDQYMKRLNAIQAANGGAPASSTSIATQVLRAGKPVATSPVAPPKPEPSLGQKFRAALGLGGKAFSAATGFGMTFGGSVLDNIARGNYGVANVFTNAAEQGKSTSFDFLDAPVPWKRNETEGRTSVGEDLGALWRGLTLQDKNTFGDALREAGYEKGFGRAAGGFTLDVLADPINLIPASLIARGAQGAGRAASKLPGLNRPIVSGRVDEVVIPETVKVENTPLSGPAAAPVGAPVPGMPAPASPAPETASGRGFLDEIWGDTKKAREAATGDYVARSTVAGYPASSQAEGLFDLNSFADQSLFDTVESTLQNVPATRKPYDYFRDDVPIGTEPILEDVTKEVTKSVGGVKPRQYLMQRLMSQEFRNRDPRTLNLLPPKEYTGRTITQPGGTAQVVTRAQLADWAAAGKTEAERASRMRLVDKSIENSVDALLKKGRTSPNKRALTFKVPNRKDQQLTFAKIMEDVLDETPIEAMNVPGVPSKAEWILKGSDPKKPVRYLDLIKSLRENLSQLPQADKITETITEQIQTGERTLFSRGRPDELSREAWKGNMKLAGFSEKEINALIRNANFGEKQYDSLLQKILASPFSRQYTMDDFADAVRNGEVDDTVESVQKMYRMLGIDTSKHKTPKARARQFENKINALRKRMGKNPLADTADGMLAEGDQGLLFNLSKGEAKANKAKLSKAAKEGLPEDPNNYWLQRQIEAHAQPSAENIVDEAAAIHGDATVESVINSPKVSIDARQADAVAATIQDLGITQFANKKKGELWQYRTNRGAERTSATPGKGLARWPAYTRNAQYSLARNLHKNLRDLGVYKGIPEGQLVDTYLPALKATEEVIKARGIAPILANGPVGIPLSLHDIFSVMGRDWTSNFYLNRGQGIPPTHLLEGVEMLLEAHAKGGVPLKQLVGALRDIGAKPIKTSSGKLIPATFFEKYAKKVNPNAPMKVVDENFVRPLINNLPEFVKLAEQNRALMGLKTGELTKELSEGVINKFLTEIQAGDFAKAVRSMDEIKPLITKAANDAKVAHIGGLGNLVRETVESTLGEAGAGLSDAAKAAKKVQSAKSARETIAASSEHLAKMDGALDDVIVRETVEKQWEIAQNPMWRMDAKMFRLVAPHVANKDLRPFLIGETVFANSNSRRFMGTLSDMSRRYSTSDLNAAFNQIRVQGAGDNPTGAVAEMNRMVKQVFDPQNPTYDTLHRNGVLVHEMNRQMDHFAVQKNLRFKKSLDEWTEWDIDDPMDFLAKMHTSMQQLMAYKVVGSDFSTRFGSSTPKDGFVKIVNNSGKDSIIYNYIDPDKYYPQEMAQQLTVMDKYLVDMSKPANRNKVVRFYDTILYSFKAGYTIYRVGHHVRNALGDGWFNYMDGVTNPRYYNDAVHLLATGKGRYPDFEFNQALATGSDMRAVAPDSNKRIASIKVNGRKIDLTAARGYQLMYRHGGLPDHMIIEDLRYDNIVGGENADVPTQSMIPDWVRKPFGGKLRHGAVRVSEVRDHYFRAAHWIHAMENGKLPKGWKGTDEEAIEYLSRQAAARVRKYHPDGSDLTKFEREYMRRTFTFYSWARKAIPLVIEQMVLRPGRFMHYPKAMHSLAQGMGIDLESYGDPFPDDQLFPSFMRESVQGPVFGGPNSYWGLKTGNPGVDIIDEYLYNPRAVGENLLQSVSPIVRAPAELFSGSKWGNQVPILDKSDYIGQQIPNMAYADKLLNTAGANTASSLFTDQLYQAKSNEGYVPDAPGPLGRAGLFNWLLGMGLVDMSKPSHIKTAEREIPEGRGR